jgi:4-hydroxy-tetrahydrodipicolinate synthase
VARQSGLPLCIYDNPVTTHFRFGTALVARLSTVPGIIGVKSSAAEREAVAAQVAELRGAVPDGFSLGMSGDWKSVEALIVGADVWHSVVAGLFPRIGMAIVEAIRRGDHAEARRLDAHLKPLWSLFQEFSSLRVMHASAEILGICRAELPRPLLPLAGAARQRVADVIESLDLS